MANGIGARAVPPEWLAPPDLAAARAAQQAMAARVVREDRLGAVRRIGGVDVSSSRFDRAGLVHAAIVVLSWPGLVRIGGAAASLPATLPYIPGYLGFREIPVLLAAWDRLDEMPDLLLVDGHGIAHPRGLGIASQLGVVLDIPAIGVAKSLLVGRVAAPLAEAPGAEAPVLWQGVPVATALRSRARAHPVFVSTGHRVGATTALHWVRATGAGRRLPEPTRQAHAAANAQRRAVSPPPSPGPRGG